MTRWRRLVRDYEQRLDISEAMPRGIGKPHTAQDRPPAGILKRTLKHRQQDGQAESDAKKDNGNNKPCQ